MGHWLSEVKKEEALLTFLLFVLVDPATVAPTRVKTRGPSRAGSIRRPSRGVSLRVRCVLNTRGATDIRGNGTSREARGRDAAAASCARRSMMDGGGGRSSSGGRNSHPYYH